MVKQSKIMVSTLVVLMLFSLVYTSFLSTVQAEEQNLQTKTSTILSDIIGLKTDVYTTIQTTEKDRQYLDQPQKQIDTYLASSEGSMRVTSYYTKDILQLLYFSDSEGQPSLKQSTANTVDAAKSLLNRYQNYAGNSIYSECADMLNSDYTYANATKSKDNILFEAANFDQKIVNYKWTYVDSNGVMAESKRIILSYEDGQLKFFLNNWPLFQVAGTPKIVPKEATTIAVEASKDFSYQVSTADGSIQTVSGFNIAPESLGNAKLAYQNFDTIDSARGGDPFTLYPSWFVPLGFDRFYPGDVASMIVYVWADTGEVCRMQEVVTDSNGVIPTYEGATFADNQMVNLEVKQDTYVIPAQIMLAAMLCVIGVIVCSRKRIVKMVGSKALSRSKFWGILLCGSLIFSALLALPLVSAGVPVYSKSEIYACIHTPNGYHDEPTDAQERESSKTICNYIETVSDGEGYTTDNWCWDPGYGTTVNRVGQNAHSDELAYDRTAVFYVGHKASDNYAIQDDQGYPIDWQDIGTNITTREHYFIFLWVCSQAQAPTYGIPANWTHTTTLQSEGYQYPDGSGQCYISFTGYSPMVSSYPADHGHPTIYGSGYYGPCQEFIIFFYYYAFTQGYPVDDALNQASINYFSDSYVNSELNQGYSCWWPGGGPGNLTYSGYFPRDFRQYSEFTNTPDNRMRVFGDSEIKLYQPLVGVSAICDDNSQALSPSISFDGQATSVGNYRLVPKTYSISAGTVHNYQFTHFTYNGNNVGSSVLLNSDGNLVAHYNWNPTYYTLSILSSSGGQTTPAAGDRSCLSYSYENVHATPSQYYILDHWHKDGNNWAEVGCNPDVSVYMDGAHSVQPIFVLDPGYKFINSITGSGGPVTTPEYLTGWQNDGQYATLTGYGPYQVYGWVTGALNAQTSGHIYAYGAGSGALYVYTSTDGSNWNLVGNPTATGSVGWIDCGVCITPFSYLAFTTQDPNNIYSVSIDSVKVDSTQYTLSISTSGSGYTTPSGNPQYLIGTYANVQAQAYSGYVFDHWLLDGNNAGNNPSINVYMNGPHSLQAVFVQTPPAYVSSITGYGGPVSNPDYLVGSSNDGQYATLTGYGPYQVYGWVTGALNAQTSGHIYVYGSGTGALYVYTSTDGSNWNLLGAVQTPGSVGWIDCGVCSSPFSYIAFTAEDPNNIYGVSIDSVSIQP